MIKTLHESLKEFDKEFTPGTDKFSEYVLWTSDCNGDFLRTRYASKSTKQKDIELRHNTFVIVAIDGNFDIKKIEYHRDYSTHKLTKLKLQVCWAVAEDIKDISEWNAQSGYKNQYLLDCSTGVISKIHDSVKV